MLEPQARLGIKAYIIMTNREILLKSIRKAEANGFKLSNDKHTVGIEEDLLGLTPEDPKLLGYQSIIFDHNFAKALWGEENFDYEIEVGFPDGTVYDVARLPTWQYKLQQMVLEDDPIKYLENYV